MSRPLIWLFGGTTEGREIAQFLEQEDVRLYVSVATEYGASLVPVSPRCTVFIERLDYAAMCAFMEEYQPTLVIDATHPYAVVVTATIQDACHAMGVPYVRVIRPVSEDQGWVTVDSMEEAAEYLSPREGNIFLTTGSKDLDIFTRIPHYEERVAVRILSSIASLERALSLGYQGKRIVCMQGPFTTDINVAMFRHFQTKYVVTKDSGKAGGFAEKVTAAREAEATLIVVGRKPEKGLVLPALYTWLKTVLADDQ